MKSYLLLGAAVLALAACNSDTAPEGDQPTTQTGAQGEVLGGTISDGMIPLDSVTSQSPPLKIESTPGAEGDGTSASASGTGAATAEEASETAEGDSANDDAPANEEEAGE